jgi:hypothetical protein
MTKFARCTAEKNILVFTLGVLFFLIFLLMPVLFSKSKTSTGIGDSLSYSAATFYGMSNTDLAQDIIGFRAMVMRENVYPNLGLAHAKLGLDFPVDAKSTHLPTTFLFVAPIAFLTWRYASMSWALLMLLGIICTFRILGFAWPRAMGYGFLSILWLPVMMSFGQLTILWLLFVAIAYTTLNKNPFASGFFIGLASLIKLFPAVMMAPFLLQKKWDAIYGFLLAVGIGITGVFLISPKAICEYMDSPQNIQATILRSDNSSLFNVGYRYFGMQGILIAIFLLGIFLLLNRKQLCVGERIIQEQSWMFWTFLSVTLLPVIWIYSLVPLLPIILNFMRSKDIIVKLIGWASIIIPIWGYPWGDQSVPFIAGVTLLIGIGVTITNRLSA